MISLLHTADLHLGVLTHGEENKATGLNTRVEEFRDTFDEVMDYAIANDIDLFLFCGDAFHKTDPHPAADLYAPFIASVRRLADAGIQVVLLVGNHDLPGDPRRQHALAPLAAMALPNVWVADTPEARVLDTRHGRVVVGALPTRRRFGGTDEAALTRETRRYLEECLKSFRDLARAARAEDPDTPAVLGAHWQVEGARAGGERELPHGMKIVLPLEWLRDPTFDYVGLGHIHAAQVLHPQPPVVYSGSLCRINFGEEADAKGFYVARDLRPGAPTTPEFVPVTRARPLVTLPIPDAAGDVTAAIVNAVAAESARLRNAIVRVWVEAREAVTHEPAAVQAGFAAAGVHSWHLRVERIVAGEPRARGGEVLDRTDLTPADAAREWWRVKGVPPDEQETLLRHLEGLQLRAAPGHERASRENGGTALLELPATAESATAPPPIVTFRPVRLSVTNFLSYGDDPNLATQRSLDFEPLGVACLAGPNAAGKTALLDGLTFALWNEARAPARACIRHGAESARVEFHFDLDDTRYQVVREVFRAPHKTARLELLRLDAQGAVEQRLTHTSARETQAQLDRLLRVSYESFVTSSYLLQGQAGLFTAMSPADRKRVLGDILGLESYDALAVAARLQHEEDKGRLAQVEDDLARLRERVARREEVDESVHAADAAAGAARAATETAERRLADARARATAAQAVAGQLAERRRELGAITSDQEHLQAQQIELHIEITELESLVARRPEVERAHGDLRAAQELVTALEARREDALTADRALQEHRAVWTAVHTGFEQGRVGLSRQRGDLQAAVAHAPEMERKITETEAALAALTVIERERDAAEHERETLRTKMAQRGAERARCEELEAQLAARLVALRDATAACPVCAKPLAPEQRERLVAETSAELRAATDALAAADCGTAADSEASSALDERLADLRTRVAEAPHLRQRLGDLQSRLQHAQDAQATLARVAAKLAAADAEHAAERETFERRDGALVDALAAIGFDAAALAEAKRALDALRAAERDYERLAEAERLLPARRTALSRLDVQIRKKSARHADLTHALLALEQQAGDLPALAAAVSSAEAAHAAAGADERDAIALLATLRSERDRLEQQAAEIETRRADIERLLAAADAHRTLAETFSTKGAPALIIERTLPSLTLAANRVLDRLTDGVMRLQLAATRETQRGTEQETLQIEIFGDSPEPRPYELLSGGEKFRVDFALRVALSQFLAQRAGTRLQMLVIDEGFGTQDAEGRDNVLDALRSVESDFEKILVITHVEEVKDAFDYRILVAKDDRGSLLTVVTA